MMMKIAQHAKDSWVTIWYLIEICKCHHVESRISDEELTIRTLYSKRSSYINGRRVNNKWKTKLMFCTSERKLVFGITGKIRLLWVKDHEKHEKWLWDYLYRCLEIISTYGAYRNLIVRHNVNDLNIDKEPGRFEFKTSVFCNFFCV